MRLILDTAETTSAQFSTGGWFPMAVILTGYTTGTWSLQIQDPDGVWSTVDDETFNGNGIWKIDGIPGVQMRITGGGAGPKAWLVEPGV